MFSKRVEVESHYMQEAGKGIAQQNRGGQNFELPSFVQPLLWNARIHCGDSHCQVHNQAEKTENNIRLLPERMTKYGRIA